MFIFCSDFAINFFLVGVWKSNYWSLSSQWGGWSLFLRRTGGPAIFFQWFCDKLVQQKCQELTGGLAGVEGSLQICRLQAWHHSWFGLVSEFLKLESSKAGKILEICCVCVCFLRFIHLFLERGWGGAEGERARNLKPTPRWAQSPLRGLDLRALRSWPEPWNQELAPPLTEPPRHPRS